MRALLRTAVEKISEARLRRRCDVDIGKGTKVSYRNLITRPPAKLTIGTGSIVEGSITADHPDALISIGKNTFVGRAHLICAKEIEIGDDVLIAWGCTLVDHNSHSPIWSEREHDVRDWHLGKKQWDHVKLAKITVRDKVWIGFNSIILKGVTLGEGAIVGAGSVVTKNVEPYTVVAGNPACVIKRLSP